MQASKQILKATVLGTIPVMIFTYFLAYVAGGVSVIEVIKVWMVMILIIANLLLLLENLIPGGPKKWSAILIIVMMALFISPIFSSLRSANGNLYFYCILGALLILNLIVYLFQRKPR